MSNQQEQLRAATEDLLGTQLLQAILIYVPESDDWTVHYFDGKNGRSHHLHYFIKGGGEVTIGPKGIPQASVSSANSVKLNKCVALVNLLEDTVRKIRTGR